MNAILKFLNKKLSRKFAFLESKLNARVSCAELKPSPHSLHYKTEPINHFQSTRTQSLQPLHVIWSPNVKDFC